MDKEHAKHLLRDVDVGVEFRFCNGTLAFNLIQLIGGISRLTPEEFKHHVYTDHNDFSNWLFDIVGDDKLGLDMYHADKKKSIALLKARILYLQHKASIKPQK